MIKNKACLAGLIVCLAALGLAGIAEASLYKCTDKNNRIYYQDKPCQDLIAERLPSGLTSLAGKEEERAFFWKAVGQKGTLYLLGDLRYGTPTLRTLPQLVMDAYNNSQVLVVEQDIWNSTEKERLELLRGKGRYEDKKNNLENHVKTVTWANVVKISKKLNENPEALRQYKPWRLALKLADDSLRQADYSPDISFTQGFLKDAKDKKPIEKLESMENQVVVFDALSEQEQEQMLLQAMSEVERAPDYYNNLAEAWRKGDLESMDLFTRQTFEATGDVVSSKLYKLFYEDPSERMVNRLKELANEDKTYFVVIGAGHFGGDKGIIRLLQAKGFKVSQP